MPTPKVPGSVSQTSDEMYDVEKIIDKRIVIHELPPMAEVTDPINFSAHDPRLTMVNENGEVLDNIQELKEKKNLR